MKYLFALLMLIPCATALQVSEIMYNPVGNDNNLEYVELYSEEELNLSVYTFEDSSSSDILTLVSYADSSYYLLVEDGFNSTGMNASIYTTGPTLGNNLNNDQDIIMLRDDQGDVVTVMSYEHSLGGDGNGMALCYNSALVECVPTPGMENIINSSTSNETDPQQNTTTFDYSHIMINEFLPNPHGLDTEDMPDGEWIELYNEGDSIDVHGLELCDKDWNCILADGNRTQSGTFIGNRNYLVVYMNGKSLLNNANHEKVRLVYEGQILDEVSYEGSDDGSSWSMLDEEWKQTKPTPGSQNKEPYSPEQEQMINTSRILIKKISVGSDNITRFGDMFDVRVWTYKGNTEKERVVVYVENISEKVQFSVVEKYQSYELVLPIHLYDNCNREYPEGRYGLFVEGLGITLQEHVIVNYSASCRRAEEFTLLSHQQAKESLINQSMQNSPLTGNVVYRSKEERIREYSLYGFALLSVLLLGYFLLRR